MCCLFMAQNMGQQADAHQCKLCQWVGVLADQLVQCTQGVLLCYSYCNQILPTRFVTNICTELYRGRFPSTVTHGTHLPACTGLHQNQTYALSELQGHTGRLFAAALTAPTRQDRGHHLRSSKANVRKHGRKSSSIVTSHPTSCQTDTSLLPQLLLGQGSRGTQLRSSRLHMHGHYYVSCTEQSCC